MSDSISPTFHDSLKTLFNSFLGEEINTCLPGIVDNYDSSSQKATITPAISKKFIDGDILQYSPIPNVPVIYPSSEKAGVILPIKKGDTVLLCFTQRAMENWLSKGGITEPGDRRKFDITDAVAIPGLKPFSGTFPSHDGSSLLIYNEDVKIVLNEDNSVEISNSNGKVLLHSNGQVNINDGNLTVEP